jgi:hypothetical protein
MREVLEAGRGVSVSLYIHTSSRLQAGEVETPAMAAGARRATRHGPEGDAEGDGGDGVHMTVTSA